jgi:hypothetical protein
MGNSWDFERSPPLSTLSVVVAGVAVVNAAAVVHDRRRQIVSLLSKLKRIRERFVNGQ